jgi:hypothetical protein
MDPSNAVAAAAAAAAARKAPDPRIGASPCAQDDPVSVARVAPRSLFRSPM